MRQPSTASLVLIAVAAMTLAAALFLTVQALAAPAEPAATEPPLAARGRALFQAKGCVTCHIHGAFAGPRQGPAEGPTLTTHRDDPVFLRRWLADPAATRPGATMPDLGLTSDEIEALIAFLNE